MGGYGDFGVRAESCGSAVITTRKYKSKKLPLNTRSNPLMEKRKKTSKVQPETVNEEKEAFLDWRLTIDQVRCAT